MSFTSLIFLFAFFPLLFLLLLIVRGKARILFLLLGSMFFYVWADTKGFLVVVCVWLFSFVFGLLIDKSKSNNLRRAIFCLAIVCNVATLFAYKYLNFAILNINNLFKVKIELINDMIMPLGISFIIFSSISYLVDVYKNKIEADSFLIVGAYVFMFPKLTMGPIVRFEDVREQLHNNIKLPDISSFTCGLIRFVFGMSKKLIIANAFAVAVDRFYRISDYGKLSVLAAWTGSIFYSLQLFYDFSGYSDMAIGLGKMLGFEFKENFNYPYCASNITDFWRRWHISLSSWFRDYIYIPLGGSRQGKIRLIINLFVVWSLTGLWHGANWTFVVWGLYYFVLLVVEKSLHINECLKGVFAKIIYRVITLVLINLGWVIFRAGDIRQAWNYIKCMFGINSNIFMDSNTLFILKDYAFVLFFAILFCIPISKYVKEKEKNSIFINLSKVILVTGLFIICISYCMTSTYNPFIYSNF